LQHAVAVVFCYSLKIQKTHTTQMSTVTNQLELHQSLNVFHIFI